MKNQHALPDQKEQAFYGLYNPKIKRIRQQPRHQIRRLLKSFVPLIPRKQQDDQII
ncbi:hypothetical protein [Mucilaginibacter sp. RCC_168]|uniref:hypothetical protein n=1 Tax=Mucilaginibacter sp. RCC_168 TaxID=3239221 RepID=UPI003525A8F0